jgi:chemotaxis protein CheY-P-specific phosphatase CheC
MNTRCEATLARVAEKILAELAFMFSMPDDEAVRHVSSALVASSVDFVGPFSGTLALAMSANMLPAMASNMLGLDDGDGSPTPDQQRDALKELANVVCGNLLPAMAGTEAMFKIEAPQIVEAKAIEGTDQARPVARTRLTLDEGRAELALFIRGEMPALVGDQGSRK